MTFKREETSCPAHQYSMDCIFTLVGFGPWNALCCSMSFLVEALFAVVAYGSAFMVPPHDFNCLVFDHANSLSSWTTEDNCFISFSNGSQTPCQKFLYNSTTYVNTVTMEFDLVCSRESFRYAFQLMITTGGLLGTASAGFMADRWGRQKTIWLCSLVAAVGTVLNVTIPVFWVVMLTRFLVGVFIPPLHMASFVLGIEACPLKQRTWFGTLTMTPFALMMSGIAGIAYHFRDWRYVELLGSWPLLFLIILASPLLLSESPRWLVSRGRIEEASRILTRAARINKTTGKLPNDLEKHLNLIYKTQLHESCESGSMREMLTSLVSSSVMRTITFSSMTLFLIHGSLCMSIPLRANFFGSEFLYVLLLGIIQLISYLMVGPIVNRFGRTSYIFVCMVATMSIQLTLTVLMVLNKAQGTYSVCLSAIAYGAAEGAYLANLVLSAELFPTSVRAQGMTLSYFSLGFGYILPSILDLVQPSTVPWMSLAIFSVFSAVGAITVYFVPDTNKQPLLQGVPKTLTTR
ncbi:Major facilitator sugar transporter-like [Trinorchestia longiramus]|nr:Major facilitator sugar transporter-like [Trinorchestia longiramus]